MESIKGLAHVGLFSEDLKRSEDFYCGILGFKKVWDCEVEEPDGSLTHVMFLRNGDLTLEVIRPQVMPKREDGHFDHVAMRVKDIAKVQKELEAQGVEFESEEPIFKAQVFEKGSSWLMFRGPDGERLELTEVME